MFNAFLLLTSALRKSGLLFLIVVFLSWLNILIRFIYFFVDCIVVINFCTLAWIPSTNLALSREIHSLMSCVIDAGNKIKFFWAPGHNGVPENEAADSLAELAGSKVDTRSPIPNQIKIPHTVSKGMAKTAIWQKLHKSELHGY